VKSLVLFRHGKSDWDAGYDVDHSRPLAKRGRKAAALMGAYLAGVGERPDLVITSSARRARDTAERAAARGRWRCEIQVADRLYEASPEVVLDVVCGLDDDLDRVVLVGHEPAWSGVLGRLVGEASARVPTAAMASVALAIDTWRDVAFGCATLRWLVLPRHLRRIGWVPGATRDA